MAREGNTCRNTRRRDDAKARLLRRFREILGDIGRRYGENSYIPTAVKRVSGVAHERTRGFLFSTLGT